ncbi:MAG: SCP2 sterol-binding domain-containing protein [Candidatus Dormibacteraeota bacterium]|nr:SCP2 sterol-binding domain-containing protein [Candidatus Dormibacteraeota bacterium]
MLDSAAADWQHARAALAAEVPRVTALIRSVSRPDAAAVGEWNARQVAVHLSHAWTALPALARGEAEAPLTSVGELAAFTTTMVAGDDESDLAALAARIDTAAAGFLDHVATRSGDEESPWLLDGVTASLLTFAGHLLNETTVHGWDIARSQGVRWRLHPRRVALTLRRFVFPMLAHVDPRELVVQERAAELSACYEIRVRGSDRVYLTFDHGAVHVHTSQPRAVDCHISADPVAFFLVMWGRMSQWPPTLRGQLLAWGRRPWLGPRLRTLLRNP